MHYVSCFPSEPLVKQEPVLPKSHLVVSCQIEETVSPSVSPLVSSDRVQPRPVKRDLSKFPLSPLVPPLPSTISPLLSPAMIPLVLGNNGIQSLPQPIVVLASSRSVRSSSPPARASLQPLDPGAYSDSPCLQFLMEKVFAMRSSTTCLLAVRENPNQKHHHV